MRLLQPFTPAQLAAATLAAPLSQRIPVGDQGRVSNRGYRIWNFTPLWWNLSTTDNELPIDLVRPWAYVQGGIEQSDAREFLLQSDQVLPLAPNPQGINKFLVQFVKDPLDEVVAPVADLAADVGSATQVSGNLGNGAEVNIPPGMWAINSQPATGAQASAVRAAGSGTTRHVAWEGLLSFLDATAGGNVGWSLLDGVASLFGDQAGVDATANHVDRPHFGPGSNIPGSPATSMTLQFGAGVAGVVEKVTLIGYDVS